MEMKKSFWLITMLLTILTIYYLPLTTYPGVGVSFGPGEITFGNLEIGQTYDFGKISSQQFEVINKSDRPVDVKIFKFKPRSAKKGFEPIPDVKWIKVYPERLKNLEPGKKYKVSVKISIPDDRKYLGKNYQVYLQARIVSKAFMGVGADSRVLIKIKDTATGKKPELKKEPAKFEVKPLKIYIKDFKLCEDYVCKDLTVKNLSNRDLKFQIVLLGEKEANRKMFPGYKEFPGIKSSGAKVNYFTVKPGKKARIYINLYLEDKEEYLGKKYQLFVNVRTYKEEIVQEFYVPIFIEKVLRDRGFKGSRE